MKGFIVIFLASACVFSLVACGNQKPSQDEVRKAVEEGSMTLDDAVDKGWVTQKWADDFLEQRTVPAADKLEAGSIGSFTTTTLSGEEFTSEQMGDVALFAFIDPEDADSKSFYQALLDGYEEVKKNGADILVCTKKEEGNEMFEDAPFPVILYNDSLKSATENYKELIEGLANAASWCINHSFYSAWSSRLTSQELADSALDLVEFQKEVEESDNENHSGMAVVK